MVLTKNEKELLLQNASSRRFWSKLDTEKIKEAKYKLHATPAQIFYSSIFKNRTRKSIEEKYYNI